MTKSPSGFLVRQKKQHLTKSFQIILYDAFAIGIVWWIYIYIWDFFNFHLNMVSLRHPMLNRLDFYWQSWTHQLHTIMLMGCGVTDDGEPSSLVWASSEAGCAILRAEKGWDLNCIVWDYGFCCIEILCSVYSCVNQLRDKKK